MNPTLSNTIFCILVTILIPGVSGTASAEPSNGVVIKELEQDGVKGLSATFEIAQPRDVVFKTIDHLPSFTKLFPNILAYKVLKTKGNTRDVYFRVDAVLAEAEYTLRRKSVPGQHVDTITWNRISGDANVIRGAWVLSKGKKTGTTQVVYKSFVDVAMLIPTATVRSMAIGKVHDMVRRVRDASAENATDFEKNGVLLKSDSNPQEPSKP